jgi:hypothetical protein
MALDWYLGRRYSFLLLTLLLLFAIHPLLHEVVAGQWLYDLLVTVVFLAAFVLLFKRKIYRPAAVLLGVPTVFAQWTGYAFPGVPPLLPAIFFHLFAALFLGLTLAAIIHDIHESIKVSYDSIAGGFIGYLLIGIVFSHLYATFDRLAAGSFRGSEPLLAHRGPEGLPFYLLTYYSFATLTTIGYGDIIPATPPTRSLACLEAICGQFYMVVVMAELIGLKLSQQVQERRPGAG